jgi:hypothetical protein
LGITVGDHYKRGNGLKEHLISIDRRGGFWQASCAVFGFLVFMSAGTALGQDAEFVEPTEAQIQLFTEGSEAFKNFEYQRAVTLFKASLTVGELNITWLNLGRAYYKIGLCTEAREAFAKVRKAPKVASPTPLEIQSRLNEYVVELSKACGSILEPGEVVCPEGTREVEGRCVGRIACPPGTLFDGARCAGSSGGDLSASREAEVARTHSYIGFGAGAGVLALSIASAATTGSLVPSLPLGAASLAGFGVALPIVSSATANIRRRHGVEGSPSLRITGWIGYGLGMLNGLVLVVIGVSSTIEEGPIMLAGALGAASLSCFALDAAITANQLEALGVQGALSGPEPGISLIVSPRVGPEGGAGFIMGIGGAF